MTRPLYEIANEIVADYSDRGKSLPDAARAYVDPMRCLSSMDDAYGYDDAETVVIYALSNLNGWRGETARRVKRELQTALHEHNPRRYKAPK